MNDLVIHISTIIRLENEATIPLGESIKFVNHSIAEEIQAYIAMKKRSVPMSELRTQFVEVKQRPQSTFYKTIKILQSEGKIVKTRLRGGNIKLCQVNRIE